MRSVAKGDRPMLVGDGVDLALLGGELVQLVALSGDSYRRHLVGQIDLVAVPTKLPGDGHVDLTGLRAGRVNGDLGDAQRAADAGDGSRMLGGVEQRHRRGDLVLEAGWC